MRFTVGTREVFASTGSGQASGDAPAVVFVHGAGQDHTVWVMLSRYFARHGFRVLALDLPGHGRTDGPPLDSVAGLAEWLGEVMTAANVERAAVVGHSMGSLIAHRFAAVWPRRVTSLALLGMSAPMPVTELLLNAAEDNDHAAIEMANTWSHSVGGQMGGNAVPGIWMMGAGERLIERSADGVYHADFTACNGFDPAQTPDPVQAPTLVVIGDADQMTPPRAGLAVAEGLADATVVRLPGCGHNMMMERPNEVLDALSAHIKSP